MAKTLKRKTLNTILYVSVGSAVGVLIVFIILLNIIGDNSEKNSMQLEAEAQQILLEQADTSENISSEQVNISTEESAEQVGASTEVQLEPVSSPIGRTIKEMETEINTLAQKSENIRNNENNNTSANDLNNAEKITNDAYDASKTEQPAETITIKTAENNDIANSASSNQVVNFDRNTEENTVIKSDNNDSEKKVVQNENNTLKNNNSTGQNIVKKDNNMKEKDEEQVQNPTFIMPVEGEIIKQYGKEKLLYSSTLKEWTTHLGLDIKANKTTVVKASSDGVIKSVKNDPRYGLTIIIEHNNGFDSIYANLLSAEFVTVGENVKSGQTIGTVGNSAPFEILDEPHLHFEITKDGNNVDPEMYIK